jgi:dipeptidyl-peptidase 4
VEWAGENSFILRREGKQYVHDIKTGKETEYKAPDMHIMVVMPEIINKEK